VVNVVSEAMNDARVITSRARPRPVTLDPAELDDLRRVNGITGRYYVRDTEQRTPEISYDHDLQQRLRAATDSYTAMARDHNP
jgi:hypothetical protein